MTPVRAKAPQAEQMLERLREALELCGADDELLRDAESCAQDLAGHIRKLESVTNQNG
jgi:hypothetical protein